MTTEPSLIKEMFSLQCIQIKSVRHLTKAIDDIFNYDKFKMLILVSRFLKLVHLSVLWCGEWEVLRICHTVVCIDSHCFSVQYTLLYTTVDAHIVAAAAVGKTTIAVDVAVMTVDAMAIPVDVVTVDAMMLL